MITPDDIKKLFRLARIEATESDIQKFPTEVGAILEYVGQLGALKLPDVVNPADRCVNNFREDNAMAVSDDTRQTLLDAFPEREGDYLATPKVFE